MGLPAVPPTVPRLDLAHRQGNHCGSSALRDLAGYYGWGFDEPTCFGLGAGLGFSYVRQPQPPERLFFGRTSWLEAAFFETLGIEYRVSEGQAFEDAWADITEHVDDGDPVMIFTDLYYLDYFDSSTHFAPHSLLVVGYEDDRVLLADGEFGDVQALPLDRLEAALTSEHVVALQCRYLVVDDPTITVDVDDAAAVAIQETATAMLDPDAATRSAAGFGEQGIPALRQFAADLPEWDELSDPAWTARFAYQNVERRGTGGGAFRLMYADFLDSVAGRVGLPADVPGRMREVAGDWTALAEVLYEASEAEEEARLRSLLADAGDRADALADREDSLYEDLRAAV